MTRFFIDFDY